MHKNPPERLWPGPAPDHDSGDGELPERRREHYRAGSAEAVYGDGCDKVTSENIKPTMRGDK